MFENAIDDVESLSRGEMPSIVVGGAATRHENAHWRQYYFFGRDGAVTILFFGRDGAVN
jgi:hypothetical protein